MKLCFLSIANTVDLLVYQTTKAAKLYGQLIPLPRIQQYFQQHAYSIFFPYIALLLPGWCGMTSKVIQQADISECPSTYCPGCTHSQERNIGEEYQNWVLGTFYIVIADLNWERGLEIHDACSRVKLDFQTPIWCSMCLPYLITVGQANSQNQFYDVVRTIIVFFVSCN